MGYHLPNFKVRFHCHIFLFLTRLALEKTAAEPDAEDNAQTIKPNKSPGPSKFLPLAQPPPSDMIPIIEDYSDLGTDDDDDTWQDRVEVFKVRRCQLRELD